MKRVLFSLLASMVLTSGLYAKDIAPKTAEKDAKTVSINLVEKKDVVVNGKKFAKCVYTLEFTDNIGRFVRQETSIGYVEGSDCSKFFDAMREHYRLQGYSTRPSTVLDH